MKTQRGRETEGGREKESQRERGRIACAREKIDTGRKDLVKEIKREYVCVHQSARAEESEKESERELVCVCGEREGASTERRERSRAHICMQGCEYARETW